MKKLLKSQEDKEQFLEWLDWLNADVLPQGTNVLEGDKGFCCLGVACVVLIEKPDTCVDYFTRGTELSGMFPTAQPKAPRWLKKINDHFAFKTKFLYDNGYWSKEGEDDIYVGQVLSELNDNYKCSFPTIARLLYLTYKDEL